MGAISRQGLRPPCLLAVVLALCACDDGDIRLRKTRPPPAYDPAESMVNAAMMRGRKLGSGQEGLARLRGAADGGAGPGSGADGGVASVDANAGERTPFVRSSRCGECHEAFFTDWQASVHRRATQSPQYQKALAALGADEQAACRTCHLPGHAYGQQDLPGVPSEGVSCDACHTLAQVTVSARGARMVHKPELGAKFAPIVGASGHYFHDMAYSALHTKSEVCAGCHHALDYEVAGRPTVNVPVALDYSGWQRFGKGACQDCHMPSQGTRPVAKGSVPRADVPWHRFPGPEAGQRLRLDASHDRRADALIVEISHKAGHPLPSGHADRRLILRAVFKGEDGAALQQIDRAYGVFLVDAAGAPAPFFRAAKISRDQRIAPGKPQRESFPVPPGAVKAEVALLAAPTAPELAAAYGPPALAPLRSAALTLHHGGHGARPTPSGE